MIIFYAQKKFNKRMISQKYYTLFIIKRYTNNIKNFLFLWLRKSKVDLIFVH